MKDYTKIKQWIDSVLKENPELDYDDFINATYQEAYKMSHEELIKKSLKNKDLVGRCFYRYESPGLFPKMKKYYKIISYQSTNEYRVECLTFYEHPTYWFNYKSHLAQQPGDYYLGSFDFSTFRVEDEMARYFLNEDFIEISLDEYNEAIISHAKELVEMPWCANHYRYGNKLPTDPDWPQEDKL